MPVLNTGNPSDEDTHTQSEASQPVDPHSTNHTKTYRKEATLCLAETDGPQQERLLEQ